MRNRGNRYETKAPFLARALRAARPFGGGLHAAFGLRGGVRRGTRPAAAAQVRAEPEKEKPENLIGTKKSETVYVNLDPTGRPYDTVVTDWLHSDTPGVTFEDVSDLKDIENIKGDRAPGRRGSA